MDRLITLAKVFSDKNRLSIFAMTLRDTELCVCEFCDTLHLSQPLVSRHLKQMREAGILKSEQRGKWIVYSLHDEMDSFLQCWAKEAKKYIKSLPPLISCSAK